MKKKAFAILTLCISLFAAVALVGCGGSGGATGSGGGGGAEKPAVDMRTDFIWFKVEVPEGVEITDVAGDTADRAQFKFTESERASDRFIPVFDSDKNADELFDYEAKWKANSGWTESDPVKYNGKTWRSAYFTHSGGVTTEYFTDVDGGSVYVRIDNVEEHKDAVETMMKSLEFADDIAEAKTEAMDVKLDDIEIKRKRLASATENTVAVQTSDGTPALRTQGGPVNRPSLSYACSRRTRGCRTSEPPQMWQQYENDKRPNTSARRFIVPRRQLNQHL